MTKKKTVDGAKGVPSADEEKAMELEAQAIVQEALQEDAAANETVAEAAPDTAPAEEMLDAQQILTDAKTEAANVQTAIDEAPAEEVVTHKCDDDIFQFANLAYDTTLSLFDQLSDVYEKLTNQPIKLTCWTMAGREVSADCKCALTEYVITRAAPISGETLWRKAAELGVHHYPSDSFGQLPLPVQMAYGHFALTARTNHAALVALRDALAPDPVAKASPPVAQDQTIFETLGNVLGLDPDFAAEGK